MYVDKNGKKWYKGNLHMHTTMSDGQKTPEEACRIYRQEGYDFLALTDHWVLSEEGKFEDMLLLPGCEYHVDHGPRGGVYHIVAIGTKTTPQLVLEESEGPDIVREIHKAGGLAALAHPAWSFTTPEMIEALPPFDMVEIYNTFSGAPYNVRPYSGDLLDVMAVRGKTWPMTATDDSHYYKGENCRSYIMLEAEEFTHEAIYASLKAGKFYATQGPLIDARVEGDHVVIDTTPAEQVIYYTGKLCGPGRCDIRSGLTHSTYPFHEGEHFVRAEVTDAAGNRAFTPYFFC